MKYFYLRDLSAKAFKRRTGITKMTFDKMVEIVSASESKRKKLLGRPQKLSYEDQILMTFEYLREYRTYFHIAIDYGMSESNTYKIIQKIEDILIKTREFKLPNKKQLLVDNDIEVLLIDVAESPIERPKKNKENTTLERKKGIP